MFPVDSYLDRELQETASLFYVAGSDLGSQWYVHTLVWDEDNRTFHRRSVRDPIDFVQITEVENPIHRYRTWFEEFRLLRRESMGDVWHREAHVTLGIIGTRLQTTWSPPHDALFSPNHIRRWTNALIQGSVEPELTGAQFWNFRRSYSQLVLLVSAVTAIPHSSLNTLEQATSS